MKHIFTGLLVCCLFTATAQKQKTMLFIGAHPDDETAITEVLVKYAKLNYKVIVMIATDGKDGTRVTNIPAGDSLGMLRKKETACGCAVMGIEPPIFLSIERLDTKKGTGNYFKYHRQLMDSLTLKIPQIKPDIIITAGPDGDTHHAEHIVVSGAITELLLREGWVNKYPLYYFTWKKDKEDLDELGYVDEQYLNVQVDYSDEEKKTALKVIECFVTQYTEAEMKEEAAKKIKDKQNTVYFRKFVTAKGLKKDFY